MKKRLGAGLIAACLMLTGCASLLEREYVTVEEHSSKYWESGAADTLRAESYQDIVNDLLLLIGRHTESAVLRLYDFEDEKEVSDSLERAAAEVQQETPMGAYAVEYITSETQRQRSYYEVVIRIGYRRTMEQIQSVVNATSTAALAELLNAMMRDGRTEMAVRLGYWGSEDPERVELIVEQVREQWGLTETPPWIVAFYPSDGAVGLLEFVIDENAQMPAENYLEGSSGEADHEEDLLEDEVPGDLTETETVDNQKKEKNTEEKF